MFDLFCKYIRVAYAGIKVLNVVNQINNRLTKDIFWPSSFKTKTFDIHIFAPKHADSTSSLNEVHGAFKNLWLYFAERHEIGGSISKCLINNWLCPQTRYYDLRQLLVFWLRNYKLIINKQVPITNPIWIKAADSRVARISVEPRMARSHDIDGSITVVVNITSSDAISEEEREELFLFLDGNYEWVIIRLTDNWEIIQQAEKMVSESQNWKTVTIPHPFKKTYESAI
jgi:hypothetical protein